MFIRGRIATHDGTPVPNDVVVARICNNKVRQEVYTSLHGDFSMQLGSRVNSVPQASEDSTSPFGGGNRDTTMGIPRRELMNCEIKVSASGFRSDIVNLMSLDTSNSSIDVGTVVVRRLVKVEGMTVNATVYKAPKDARKAYEKGVEAERNDKPADAQKYFETAVELYPTFAIAWFHLGVVLEKENQNEAARTAYTKATAADEKFLPPYLFLASMAYEEENWKDVLELTNRILDLDPFNKAGFTGYVLDLDSVNYNEVYFYNAVANYKLNRMEDAEKSALKAERLDLRTRFPQLHLLLAELFTRKKSYGPAITEVKIYLALAPNAKDADRVRAQLAKLEKLKDSASTSEKPDQM